MFKSQKSIYSRCAVNSAQSQSFGRRLYCVEQGSKTWWVKQQLLDVNAEYERSFLNELDVYEKLNALESSEQSILCNFSISDLKGQPQKSEQFNAELYVHKELSVEHAEALFAKKSAELSFSDVRMILENSLAVLHHLHQLQFIHGDLKVAHFRHTDFGATLIDFEQSCHIDQVSHFLHTATPRYMAPELFHGQAKSYASDIYALGIVWLEWLTGQKLSASSYYDWAILHCQQLQPNLCAEYQPILSILRRMLAKQKTDRFQTISEIHPLLIKG